MDYWKNKVVWITGASSGIGEALAVAIASKGGKVALSARREEKLEEIRSRLHSPSSHLSVPMDVKNHGLFEELYATVKGHFGQVDILVNNAGISQRALGAETKNEVEEDIFSLNYVGPVRLAKTLLPDMLERGSGQIVNISSVSGKFGFPLRTSYSASKHALHGYFDSLRFEVEDKGVHILMVCPGRIRTNISFHAREADGKEHATMDPGQAKGLSAEYCARRILAAIEDGKDEIYIGKEGFLVYIKTLFPALFKRIVRRVGPS